MSKHLHVCGGPFGCLGSYAFIALRLVCTERWTHQTRDPPAVSIGYVFRSVYRELWW